MSTNSKIEWCDHTFNPWIGCTKVSPGCDSCYAAVSTPARTLKVAWGTGMPRHRTSEAAWRLPLAWEKRAAAFHAEHGRRQRVFCASLADVFDNEVDPAWRRELFDLIELTPNLDWLLLTKRISNVAEMISRAKSGDWLNPHRNVWLGITVVNQEEANRDIPKLLALKPVVRFLSIEPMLGPITFRWASWVDHADMLRTHGRVDELDGLLRLDWIIAGGESGRAPRPGHPDWYRSLRDQCEAAEVPFLFKQWGEWAPFDRSRTDGATLATPYSLDEPIQKFGKKLSGRFLDGIEHNGFPA